MTTDRTIIDRNHNEDTEVIDSFCISGSTSTVKELTVIKYAID